MTCSGAWPGWPVRRTMRTKLLPSSSRMRRRSSPAWSDSITTSSRIDRDVVVVPQQFQRLARGQRTAQLQRTLFSETAEHQVRDLVHLRIVVHDQHARAARRMPRPPRQTPGCRRAGSRLSLPKEMRGQSTPAGSGGAAGRRPGRPSLQRVGAPRRGAATQDLPWNSSRPISMRRISLVPAPISYSLASRSRRPAGNSLM